MRTLATVILILSLFQASFSQGEEEQQLTTLTIATDSTLPPITFLDPNGTFTGFDIELLQAVAAAAGINYQLESEPWPQMFAMVQDNQVDLAVSGITITDARKEIYDFSVPYFLSTHKILALKGTDIQSAQDLVGKVVAVKNGTTGMAAAEKIYGGDNPNILKFENSSDAIQAVKDGKAAAYVDDSAIVDYAAANDPAFVVISDPHAFESELYGFMFPKGSAWVAPFNTAITAVLKNGDYTTLFQKWFGATPDVAFLLRAGMLENPNDIFEESLAEEMEMANEEGNAEMGWELENWEA